MITSDRSLVEGILALPEIRASSDADQLVYIDHPNAIYILVDGCLFPSVVKGDVLSVHAAIPESRRGATAVNAGRAVIKWALEELKVRFIMSRIHIGERHINVYARLCGMTKYSSDSRFNYYGVS